MDLPTSDIYALLWKLLPGLLASTVFLSLTAHPRRDVFDRVVSALIFTLLAQLAVSALKGGLVALNSKCFSFGEWTPTSELAWGAVSGVALGVLWAHLVNNGWPHRLFAKLGTTKRTSAPTEWFQAHSKWERYVVLDLKNGRRLFGWPFLWPDHPESGHFVLQDPAWLLRDGSEIRMHEIEAMLVTVSDVASVSFLRLREDPVLNDRANEIESSRKALVDANRECSDEKQSTPSTPSE